MALIASVVLFLALGLVGFALATANQRSQVSALQSRMESYVYLVLAAAEVSPVSGLNIGADLEDPSLNQPGSGIYAQVTGSGNNWQSSSSLGLQLPVLSPVEPGVFLFMEPSNELDVYALQYGVAWQTESGAELPLIVSIMVDPIEIKQQTNAFQRGLWSALGTAGLILLLAQVLLIYLGFKPLQKVARDVASVESGRVRRLEGEYPSELEPLARNVNRLLDTEMANQKRYRNALDSLAHGLKTPLAILQAGLETDSSVSQTAMRKATDEMNQLITTRLQRAATSARSTMAQPVPVAPVIERLLGSLQKVHSHKMISADVSIPTELLFFGEQRDLMELMGNLLDNAFKYGKSRIRLSAGALDDESVRAGLWIQVEDDGPGIDQKEWPALLQRGIRGDEREEGYGLGLAIVLELLTAYGGGIEIGHSDLGGALISINIPAS